MKSFIFWYLQALLQQYVISVYLQEERKFNFPLEIRSSNIIYLDNYQFDFVQAPFYSIVSENQLNLTINQSIQNLYQIQLDNSSIKMGSNFNAQSKLYSNNFWVINQEQVLYKGQIKGDGQLLMKQLDFTTQAGCFQMSLISDEIGMFSCQDQGQLYFVILNSTSLQSEKFVQDYSFPSEYQNPVIEIFNVTKNNFTFCLIYTTPNEAHIVYFTFDQTNIDLVDEKLFDGSYTSIFFLNNMNFLFLINSQRVYLVDLNQNTGNKEIANQSILHSEDLQPITHFAAFKIQNNILRMVVLQNQIITSFLYDTDLITQNAQLKSFKLNEYHRIFQLEVTIDNIYMVTDTFIIYLQCLDSIKAKGYYSLNSVNYALIQPLRNIVIVQEFVNNNSNIFSTYSINQPQILISKEQTKQIQQQILPIKYEFLVFSQIQTEQIKYMFQIQIVQVDLEQNQLPILFHQEMNDLKLRFQEDQLISREQIFLGPNLTSSIKSIDSVYLYNQTPESLGWFQMYSITYQSGCLLYQQEQYICTQFKNKTVLISIDYPTKSKQMHFIHQGLTMIKCSCEASLTNINVIMQFSTSVLVQQFDFSLNLLQSIAFPQDKQITSAQILQDNMFITTIDGKLTAKSLLGNQQLFTINDHNFKEIYTNPIDYPNFLFLDNFSNLVILAINGKQSYEMINRIAYPIQNHTSNVAIGILKDGIYMAFRNKNQSFLYFYPKINIFIQNNVSTQFQVYLDQFQIYQNEKILSSFTSCNFYLLLKKGIYYHISQFQASGTSYQALKISKQYKVQDGDFPLNFSCIFQKELKYDREIIYIFTNRHITLTRPFLSYDFILTTRQSDFDLDEQPYVRYMVSNKNFTNYIFQNISIVYDRNFLIARNKDFHLKQNYCISDQGQIMINPQDLFYGNIQNYTATCDRCRSFNFSQPIDLKKSFNFKFGFNNMLNYQNLIYVTDRNTSFYQLNVETNELINLYNLSHTNEECNNLFVEIVTKFPVQVCYNNQMVIYAYNTTSKQKITYYSEQIEHYYTSHYKNGILQVFDGSLNNQLNYYAFYLWISNNKIYLMQIHQHNAVCMSCYIKPVYLNMSSNYTTQPCQIFGFITTLQNGYENNDIVLLKNCIPSNVSEIFGFTPNKTTPEGNVYYRSQNWKLKSRMAVAWPFQEATIQFGSAKQITKTKIEAKFIVSLPDLVDLYLIQFNSTNGQIISFEKDQSFNLACNYSVSSQLLFDGEDEMLLIYNDQANHYQTPQIYSYEDRKNMIQFNYQKINGIVGYESLLMKPTKQYLSNHYYILGNDTHSTLFYIQNYLNLSVDLQGIQNAKIDITSYNPSKSVTQTLYIVNQYYNNNTYKSLDVANLSVENPDKPDIKLVMPDISIDDEDLPMNTADVPLDEKNSETDADISIDDTDVSVDDTDFPLDNTNVSEDDEGDISVENTVVSEDDTDLPLNNTNVSEDDEGDISVENTDVSEDDEADISSYYDLVEVEQAPVPVDNVDNVNANIQKVQQDEQDMIDNQPEYNTDNINIPSTPYDNSDITETEDTNYIIFYISGCLTLLTIIALIFQKLHSYSSKKEKAPLLHLELSKG